MFLVPEEIKYRKEKSKIETLENNCLYVCSGEVVDIRIKSDWVVICTINVDGKYIENPINRFFSRCFYDGEKYVSDINLRMWKDNLYTNRISLIGLIILLVKIKIIPFLAKTYINILL